jgi:hypothetical protein
VGLDRRGHQLHSTYRITPLRPERARWLAHDCGWEISLPFLAAIGGYETRLSALADFPEESNDCFAVMGGVERAKMVAIAGIAGQALAAGVHLSRNSRRRVFDKYNHLPT